MICREALEQQLKQTEEASTAQLQSAHQAAVTQAVQHSNQYQVELERAAGQRKQLQAQVQELQAALTGKESELGAVQMQLAAALESSKRVQESHGKVSNGAVAHYDSVPCLHTSIEF
jgi:predicted  nucleic acid-binding Zn-ribbon protein